MLNWMQAVADKEVGMCVFVLPPNGVHSKL